MALTQREAHGKAVLSGELKEVASFLQANPFELNEVFYVCALPWNGKASRSQKGLFSL